MDISFSRKVDAMLREDSSSEAIIEEGTILNVNTVISDALNIPEGDYIIAVVGPSKCTLIPTNEANKQDKFEVFKPTLNGFFNPEVHKKTIQQTNDDSILET